ncbi:glycosyltransferase, partial [Thermoproteota archaeon]
MKIAVFTDTFIPEINGVVTSAKKLLIGLEKRGHGIIVFSPKYATNIDHIGKAIKIIRYPSASLPNYKEVRFVLPNAPDIANRIRLFKPDVIYSLTPASMGLVALSIAKMFNTPLVSTFHTFVADPEYLKHIKLDKIKGADKAIWKWCNTVLNRCNAITSPSKATKKELQANGVKKSIKVISNGIDTSKIKQKS